MLFYARFALFMQNICISRKFCVSLHANLRAKLKNRLYIMKKIFILCLLAMMSLSTWAEGHLKFKGVEIDGTPIAFARKLQQKGFTGSLTPERNSIMLEGAFAGYTDCFVYIPTEYDFAIGVVVSFPELKDWESFYANYTNIKDMLIRKYGQPETDVYEWQGFKPDTDYWRWYKLGDKELDLETQFTLDNGFIVLSYTISDESSVYITLNYYDAANIEKAKQSAIEDL